MTAPSIGAEAFAAEPWQAHAVKICEAVTARLHGYARSAADEMYAKLMESTQDYLKDNVEYNLISLLAAPDRSRASPPRQPRLSRLATRNSRIRLRFNRKASCRHRPRTRRGADGSRAAAGSARWCGVGYQGGAGNYGAA